MSLLEKKESSAGIPFGSKPHYSEDLSTTTRKVATPARAKTSSIANTSSTVHSKKGNTSNGSCNANGIVLHDSTIPANSCNTNGICGIDPGSVTGSHVLKGEVTDYMGSNRFSKPNRNVWAGWTSPPRSSACQRG